jgi:hypothetical protein
MTTRAAVCPAWIRLLPALLTCAATVLACASRADACDGNSYSFNVPVGGIASGGGLIVRLDKAKFINDTPDKYYISIKDNGVVLADHVLLRQFDTVTVKTACGNVSIGADRKSFFGGHTLALNWSYF